MKDTMEFNYCIVGTGMTEVILSAALSLRGFKVLHIDKNDTYGDLYKNFALKHIRNWISQKNTQKTLINRLASKQDSEANYCTSRSGAVSVNRSRFLRAFTENYEFQEEPYYFKHFEWHPFQRIDSNSLVDSKKHEDSAKSQYITTNSNKFSIDLIPKIFYSVNDDTQLIYNSGVHNYVSFQAIKGQDYCSLPERETYSHLLPFEFETLPISKGAITYSKYLTLKEKRGLSRLFSHSLLSASNQADQLSFVSRPVSSVTAVCSLANFYQNIELGPQKPATPQTTLFPLSGTVLNTETIQSPSSQKLTEQQLKSSWNRFLEIHELSARTRRQLTHGICLKQFDETLEFGDVDKEIQNQYQWTVHSGIKRLYHFLSSLGKYVPHCAYLWPIYGSSDVLQAFARLSGVYGATFMLNTYIQDFPSEQKSTDVHSNEYNASEANKEDFRKSSYFTLNLSNGSIAKVKHLILSRSQLPLTIAKCFPPSSKENDLNSPVIMIARMIAVLNTSVLKHKESQKNEVQMCLVYISSNSQPIQVIQTNSFSGTCPANTFLLYLSQVYYTTARGIEILTSQTDKNDLATHFLYKELYHCLKTLVFNAQQEKKETESETLCIQLYAYAQIIEDSQEISSHYTALDEDITVLNEIYDVDSNFFIIPNINNALMVCQYLFPNSEVPIDLNTLVEIPTQVRSTREPEPAVSSMNLKEFMNTLNSIG